MVGTGPAMISAEHVARYPLRDLSVACWRSFEATHIVKNCLPIRHLVDDRARESIQTLANNSLRLWCSHIAQQEHVWSCKSRLELWICQRPVLKAFWTTHR